MSKEKSNVVPLNLDTGVHEVDIIIVVEKIVGKGWLDGRRWLEI